MKKKEQIISIFIGVVVGIIVLLFNMILSKNDNANKLYQVYLNGDKIGIIDNKDALYKLINKKQKDIKDKYQVDYVYPPNNLSITKLYTYDDDISNIEDVYNIIEAQDDFTVKGYSITIKYSDSNSSSEESSSSEVKDDVIINVLDKNVFEKAIDSFIYAFVDEDKYNNYMNGSQSEIEDVGNIIEDMYFNENIIIKETYISVNDKIYTNATELSQYLLFGSTENQISYSVKEGDTIASISEDNKLNTQEFLIANPKYASEDSLLAIGDIVNVTLINPVLTLTYQLYSVEDVEQYFEKNTVYDNSKPSSYSEVTTAGVNGITRVASRYAVINGEQSQGIVKVSEEVIREKVDQVTTKGKKSYTRYYNYGSYVNIGGDWGWPTNSGYIITSRYGYRWGKFHEGIDIALGYGSGSPIYSIADGTVVSVMYQNTGGKMIIIDHGNNMYSMYAHLSAQLVKQGATVKRGEVIGKMGSTGFATGPHLHLSVSIGMPYSGSYKFINPLSIYK